MRTIRTSEGRVYLLWCEGSTLFKIGFTRGGVDDRARQIQTSCPLPIRIQGELAGSTRDEDLLHKECRPYRTVGEWFNLPEAVVWKLLVWFGRGTTCQS